MRIILLAIFFVLSLAPLQAQQLIAQQNDYYIFYNLGYNTRYHEGHSYRSFDAGNYPYEPYVRNKVKRIEIFDYNDRLIHLTELDTAGKVVTTGSPNGYYFITHKNIQLNRTSWLNVKTFLKDNQVVRVDSLFHFFLTYANKDTTITYSLIHNVVRKRGDEINAQNQYYNEHYYNKRLTIKPHPWALITTTLFDSDGNWVGQDDSLGPKIYLDHLLPTDYDSLSMYLCMGHSTANSLYAYTHDSVANDYTDIPLESLVNHPFVRAYNQHEKKECPSEGECFDEPLDYVEYDNYGHYHYEEWDYYDDGYAYGYTNNNRGLYDTYYSDYYTVDTTQAGIAYSDSINRARDSQPEPMVILPYGHNRPFVKRVEVPKRTVIHRYRYEYFE